GRAEGDTGEPLRLELEPLHDDLPEFSLDRVRVHQSIPPATSPTLLPPTGGRGARSSRPPTTPQGREPTTLSPLDPPGPPGGAPWSSCHAAVTSQGNGAAVARARASAARGPRASGSPGSRQPVADGAPHARPRSSASWRRAPLAPLTTRAGRVPARTASRTSATASLASLPVPTPEAQAISPAAPDSRGGRT